MITTRRPRRVLPTLLAAALTLPLVGCGSSDENDSGETLTVFAAASLTGTFTELGRLFEASHPGVTVSFSFGGSSDLVTQIQDGAPADVFAAADQKNMDKLTDDQKKALADLQKEIDTKLDKMLTDEQKAEFKKMKEAPAGGPGGFPGGAGGKGGFGKGGDKGGNPPPKKE